jgi:hypothetical protein
MPGAGTQTTVIERPWKYNSTFPDSRFTRAPILTEALVNLTLGSQGSQAGCTRHDVSFRIMDTMEYRGGFFLPESWIGDTRGQVGTDVSYLLPLLLRDSSDAQFTALTVAMREAAGAVWLAAAPCRLRSGAAVTCDPGSGRRRPRRRGAGRRGCFCPGCAGRVPVPGCNTRCPLPWPGGRAAAWRYER